MKNRALCITRNVIPYVKELRSIAGSVTASILMQQLDYWFDRSPDGFWKFLEPCTHKMYRQGDSWTEELGFSSKEFWTAFKQIGIAYKSKTQFYNETDKFQGKYYASYYDRNQGITYYFRNHLLVDTELDRIMRQPTPQKAKQYRQNQKVSGAGNDDRAVPEVTNGQFDIYRDHPENLYTEDSLESGATTNKEEKAAAPIRAMDGEAYCTVEKRRKAQLKIQVRQTLQSTSLSKNIGAMIDQLPVEEGEDALIALEGKIADGLEQSKWAGYFVGILKRKIDPNLNKKPLTVKQIKKMHSKRQKMDCYDLEESCPPIRIKKGGEWIEAAFSGYYQDDFGDGYEAINYYLYKEFEGKRYVNRHSYQSDRLDDVEVYPA